MAKIHPLRLPPVFRSRRPWLLLLAAALMAVGFSGCTFLRIDVFDGDRDPLRETVLEGEGRRKIALVTIQGPLRSASGKSGLRSQRNVVPEVVAQLKRAAEDSNGKAVVLKINSPGGTVTASEQLYHEIKRFKTRTGLPLVAQFMDVAASGGYYAALPADTIIAHPTTITGSVGVIYLMPKIDALMDKVGVEMEVIKSGDQKDMGSVFRSTAPREAQLLQEMISQLAQRFVSAMALHRPQTEPSRAAIATARIFLGSEALELGLVDSLGFLTDGIAQARTMAGLPGNAKVVAYQRRPPADGTLYHTPGTRQWTDALASANPLARLGLEGVSAGFYYLWLPGTLNQ